MEAKGEGKYDDDDKGGAKGGSDAKGGNDDAEAKDGNDDELLRKVFDFYYENTELEETLQKFAFDNAAIFDDDHKRDGEYLLEHTEIHTQFKKIFEEHIEAFIVKQGVEVGDFYRTIAKDQARSTELYSGHTFAAVINSAMSFDNFYELMQDAKRGEFYWGVPLLQDMDTLEFLF